MALNRRRLPVTRLADRVRLLLGDRRATPRMPVAQSRGAHDIAAVIAPPEQPTAIRVAGVAQALQQLATGEITRHERSRPPRHDTQRVREAGAQGGPGGSDPSGPPGESGKWGRNSLTDTDGSPRPTPEQSIRRRLYGDRHRVERLASGDERVRSSLADTETFERAKNTAGSPVAFQAGSQPGDDRNTM